MILEVRVEDSERLRQYYSEHTLVVIMTQLREDCLHPVTPLYAEFDYPRPPNHEEYMGWFGVHVQLPSNTPGIRSEHPRGTSAWPPSGTGRDDRQ
ncbi:AraC family transcriptional regulator ligand-binding domain-containing protein [Metapseudomonas resinovorans]|uniref:AraC family transcriptional regulator ligand-binding domain-containing protein n=1 Tax=Metapseudomonas resinovorans TaxID=53412 RepID=UPI0012DD1E8F